jgi:capsule polysaccharide export protein KpsE/RkpR
VRDIVIKQTKLAKKIGGGDREHLHRWLDSRVDIRSLRGGIVSIETKSRDTALAREIVAAYANAMQDRLAQIGRTQTAYKRSVLLKLVAEAATGLAQAQSNYDSFRLLNRTTSPSGTVELVNSRMAQLEAAIKAKQIDLTVARQLYTDNNNVVRQIVVELGALRNQLAQVRATSPGGDTTLGQAVTNSGKLFKLERELGIARALYDSYLRYLQGTAVEDMTSNANVRILEPAFIDTERQIWWPAFSAALAALLLWGAVEVYRMRPPVGARIPNGAEHG